MVAEFAWYILAWCLASFYIIVVACNKLAVYKGPNKMVSPELSADDLHVFGLEPQHCTHDIKTIFNCGLRQRKLPHSPKFNRRKTILFDVEATNFEKSVHRRYFRNMASSHHFQNVFFMITKSLLLILSFGYLVLLSYAMNISFA
ncbi:hypothetical protein THRCLA_20801 [Thraustotheca clavata]|uniref:Uncharacterized protein n=1 Tax=Thraustotheca clavata TaxID=74557 RepID=A0A1W0A3E6_9STRA|nr:hypothetical protein THRCLA_20801 [Thraustotheca clavata]